MYTSIGIEFREVDMIVERDLKRFVCCSIC